MSFLVIQIIYIILYNDKQIIKLINKLEQLMIFWDLKKLLI